MAPRRQHRSISWLLVPLAAACLGPLAVHAVVDEVAQTGAVSTAGVSTERVPEGSENSGDEVVPLAGEDDGVRRPRGGSSAPMPPTTAHPTTTAAPTTTTEPPATTAPPTTDPPATEPPPTEPPATDPPPPPGETGRVLELVNDVRSGVGCGALAVDPTLERAAQLHSDDMSARGYMEHTNPEGQTPTDRAHAAGYTGPGVGENIAMGYPTPEAVMDGWMNSQGHRENIENCDYTSIGIGYAPDGNYWTQNFGL
jgi:uncharacterized protein YkwD